MAIARNSRSQTRLAQPPETSSRSSDLATDGRPAGLPPRHAQLLATVHAGAWRADPPSPALSSPVELFCILPRLLQLGSAGLIWPRLQDQAGGFEAGALALEYVAQGQREHNRRVEQGIVEAVTRLRGVGIDPVVLKGWAVARLYPAPAVRLCGDIDLWVRAGDFARATEALADRPAAAQSIGVDLHQDAHWPDPGCPDLLTHAIKVPLDGIEVLVPSPEDHLRLLCLHFLGHGARRPLWLCDIALLLETRPPDFDWARCLGRGYRAGWILTTLRLAHELLGAEIAGTPAATTPPLPRWLVAAVVARFECSEQKPEHLLHQIADNPSKTLTALRQRWPDPITATVRHSVYPRFDNLPRFPVQCGAVMVRAAEWLVEQFPRQTAALARRQGQS